jgi:hypothetical protein
MAGRPNLIDTHPDRREIIAAILAKTPIPQIAAKYGVSDYAIYRYKNKDMPESVRRAAQALVGRQLSKQRQEEMKDLDPFIDTAIRYQKRFEKIADKAENGSDYKAAVMSLREGLGANEYHARLAGRLDTAPTVNHNTIVVMPSSLAPAAAPAPLALEASQVTETKVLEVEFIDITPAIDPAAE